MVIRTLDKNEYLALELTKCWINGLPNRSHLTIGDMLECYKSALKFTNNLEKEYTKEC